MKSFRNNFPTWGVIFLDNKSIHRLPFKNRKRKTLSLASPPPLHSSVHESLELPVSTRHFRCSLTDPVFCGRPAGSWPSPDESQLCLVRPLKVCGGSGLGAHYPPEGACCTSKRFRETTRASFVVSRGCSYQIIMESYVIESSHNDYQTVTHLLSQWNLTSDNNKTIALFSAMVAVTQQLIGP